MLGARAWETVVPSEDHRSGWLGFHCTHEPRTKPCVFGGQRPLLRTGVKIRTQDEARGSIAARVL